MSIELFRRPDPFVGALESAERQVTGGGGPVGLVRYQEDPIGFAVDILGIPERTIRWSLNPGYGSRRWDGTPDPLAAIAESLAAWKSVGVESGTGTGKSFQLGWLYLWFVACWKNARVFTFAPKEDQLRLYSWSEMQGMWPRFQAQFPSARKTDLRIRMVPNSDEWGVWGYPVQVRAGQEVAVNAAGMHAEHMLLAYEETPGIQPAVLEAGEQTSTSPHNLRLAVGNPDNQFDALHQHCEKPDVVAIRISALDHPNVVTGDHDLIPGAVSRVSIDRRRNRNGEDSRLYQSRVRGVSPSEAEDALIRLVWVEEAVARYNDMALRAGLPARGVDVANSEDGDEAAIARGLGSCLLEVAAFQCPDASKLGSRVAIEMAIEGVLADHVGVDSVGVGASTVNKMRELGRHIRALNGGEAAHAIVDEDLVREKSKPVTQEEKFRNLRAQMWWQLRMDLQHGRIGLPDDRELIAELIAPKWEERAGKIVLESKDKPLKAGTPTIKQRLGRSPNKGDAAVLWNWVRYRRYTEPDDRPTSAWDDRVLEEEAVESRRIRPRPARPRLNPLTIEAL